MSDGDAVYRSYLKRIRCLARLPRKARGLADATCWHTCQVGQLLLDPRLPLTNNAAERLLRHWVIARRLSFGTRSEQGTRAFALLPSIIDTCRARKAFAWDYLTAAQAASTRRCFLQAENCRSSPGVSSFASPRIAHVVP
jgi:transposase